MVTLTRDMVNSYRDDVAGGHTPAGLYIRDVEDFIPTLRRFDNPMLKMIKEGDSRNKVIWEFGEGDLISIDDVTTAAYTNSATLLPVTERGLYAKNYKLRIKETDEQMLVTEQPDGTGAGTIAVRRNWPAGGVGVATSGVVHIQIMGPNTPEGTDAIDSPIAMGEVFETYPEIKEWTWAYTHRGRILPDYEVKTDRFKAQGKKKMKEAAQQLNREVLSSKKNKGDGTGANPSSMGGLREATNVRTKDLSGAPLTWIDIMTLLETMYTDVGNDGMGDVFIGNAKVKAIWNSYFQKSRITGKNDDELKLFWDEVNTDFGVKRFVLNYDMDDDELILGNPNDWRLHHMEGGNWSTGLYSTQGWYDRAFLRFDGGPIFQAARRRARWYGFSEDPADYPNLHVPV